MSNNPVEQQLLRFLQSKTPEALCVSGAWGVGKTYLWTDIVLPESKSLPTFSGLPDDMVAGEVDYRQYSYVSLFGINSVDALKRTIFESRTPRNRWAEKLSREHVQTNWRAHTNLLAKIARGLIGDVADEIPTVLSNNIWDQVICIDDLERKGDGLSMRDVLGYVSFLKEQRRCKVLVLTNEDELESDDREQYDAYHEKVFDRTLIFAPTPEECCQIAAADGALRPKIVALGISNIRVTKKIQAFVEEVRPHLAPFHESVLAQAIHTLALIGWIKYSTDAPPLRFLVERDDLPVPRTGDPQSDFLSSLGEEEPPTDQQKVGWNAILNRYGFDAFDSLDVVLVDLIDNGFLNLDRLVSAASKMQQNADLAAGSALRLEAWKLIDQSFDDNAAVAIPQLIAAFKSTMHQVDPGSLNQVLRLLRHLGQDADADALIGDYSVAHAGKPVAFNLEENRRYLRPIDDPKFRASLQKDFGLSRYADNPIEAIYQIAKNRGGTENDFRVAAQATPEQIAAYLKTLHGDDFQKFVSACYFSRSSKNTSHRAVPNAATHALTMLAGESPLNAYRVMKLGITPPQPENDSSQASDSFEADDSSPEAG